MGHVDPSGRVPLGFSDQAQLALFERDLASIMAREQASGWVFVIGTTATFYSMHPGKPPGHHFDKAGRGQNWGPGGFLTLVPRFQTLVESWSSRLARPVDLRLRLSLDEDPLSSDPLLDFEPPPIVVYRGPQGQG